MTQKRATVDFTYIPGVASFGRRRFLCGIGGASLALPWLSSIETKAFGADPALPTQRYFAAFTTDHGGVDKSAMCPAESTLTDTQAMFDGHAAKFGKLVRSEAGGMASVSPVLSAASGVLSASVVSKMNVMRGFDYPFYIGHHRGGHLGNFASSDQGPRLPERMTIDELIAWSPSFYKAGESFKRRNIQPAENDRTATFLRDKTRSSGQRSSVDLFKQLVAGSASSPAAMAAAPKDILAIDKVLESYRSLRGNNRISASDKTRLDDWMTRIMELERRVKVQDAAPSLTCGSARQPPDSAPFHYPGSGLQRAQSFWEPMVDVTAAAFMCGSTRVMASMVQNCFVDFGGSWHNDVAHANNQKLLQEGLRSTFRSTAANLASKLDVADGTGGTYLDRALIQWTQEAGFRTHTAQEMTIVTFGSAGGYFKSGMYVNYANNGVAKNKMSNGAEYTGVLHRQWLANALMSMGIPRAEWETTPNGGYGDPFVDGGYRSASTPGVLTSASNKLPVIT